MESKKAFFLAPLFFCISLPIASMYGMFTYLYHKNHPNVGKYTILYMDGLGKYIIRFSYCIWKNELYTIFFQGFISFLGRKIDDTWKGNCSGYNDSEICWCQCSWESKGTPPKLPPQ